MFSWFTGKKPEVADLESIDMKPKITIPEKTRRELYDLAVAEVQEKRVSELIKRGLMELAIDPEVYSDTQAVLSTTSINEFRKEEVDEILEEYPNARYKSNYTGMDEQTYHFKLPDVSIEDLAKVLSKLYLSE